MCVQRYLRRIFADHKSYLPVFLLAAMLVLFSRPAAAEGHFIGGVDLNGYCQSIGYAGVTLDGSTVYDWNCLDSAGNRAGLSVGDACVWQWTSNGHYQLTSRFGYFYDPYSWQCWDNVNVQSGLDLNGYCQSLGTSGVSLDGYTAYDWNCVTYSGDHVPMDMGDACRWQFGPPFLMPTVGYFYDPFSWVCWDHQKRVVIQAGHENYLGDWCLPAVKTEPGATGEKEWTPGIADCVVNNLQSRGFSARHVSATFNCDPTIQEHYDAVVAVHYQGAPYPANLIREGYYVGTPDPTEDGTAKSAVLGNFVSWWYNNDTGLGQANWNIDSDNIRFYYLKNHELLQTNPYTMFLSDDTPLALIESGVGSPDGLDYFYLHSQQGEGDVCRGIADGINQYFGNSPN